MGRGAVNQKGPQAAFLAALHAIRDAGRENPGQYRARRGRRRGDRLAELFAGRATTAEVQAALEKCAGIFMPGASQEADGSVAISLGAKGDVERDLVATGEKWGSGSGARPAFQQQAPPRQPAWHLVQALHTLVTANGDPAVTATPSTCGRHRPRKMP